MAALRTNFRHVTRLRFSRNVDDVLKGASEAYSATWNLGTGSSFAEGSRKSTEKP